MQYFTTDPVAVVKMCTEKKDIEIKTESNDGRTAFLPVGKKG